MKVHVRFGIPCRRWGQRDGQPRGSARAQASIPALAGRPSAACSLQLQQSGQSWVVLPLPLRPRTKHTGHLQGLLLCRAGGRATYEGLTGVGGQSGEGRVTAAAPALS